MVRLGDRLQWSWFDQKKARRTWKKARRTWSVDHVMTAPGVVSFHLPSGIASRRCLVRIIALACLVLPGGCATPVGVERSDPQSVHRELTGNVLSTGDLSDFSQNVLRLGGITEVAEDDPKAALATIHDAVVTGFAGPNAMFAYAELAFKHAAEGGGRPYYLASAVYAFAYLFPRGMRRQVPSIRVTAGRSSFTILPSPRRSRRRTARGSSSVRAYTNCPLAASTWPSTRAGCCGATCG